MRELHGEAAGMGGGDQLLRIGAGLAAFVLEAALERIGLALEGAALRVERAGALGERSLPDGGGVTVHGDLLIDELMSIAAKE